MKKVSLCVVLVCLAFLVWTMSCQSPSSSGDPTSTKVSNKSQSNSNSSNSGTGAGMGALRLIIEDAPIEGATNIFVTISDIRIHGTGNNGENWFTTVLDSPITVDLLDLRENPLEFRDTALQPGTYNQIRMSITQGWILFPSSDPENPPPLLVPSDEIKSHLHFVLKGGMTIQVRLDFDAKNSIHVVKKGKKDSYILRPVVNAVEVKEVTGG